MSPPQRPTCAACVWDAAVWNVSAIRPVVRAVLRRLAPSAPAYCVFVCHFAPLQWTAGKGPGSPSSTTAGPGPPGSSLRMWSKPSTITHLSRPSKSDRKRRDCICGSNRVGFLAHINVYPHWLDCEQCVRLDRQSCEKSRKRSLAQLHLRFCVNVCSDYFNNIIII